MAKRKTEHDQKQDSKPGDDGQQPGETVAEAEARAEDAAGELEETASEGATTEQVDHPPGSQLHQGAPQQDAQQRASTGGEPMTPEGLAAEYERTRTQDLGQQNPPGIQGQTGGGVPPTAGQVAAARVGQAFPLADHTWTGPPPVAPVGDPDAALREAQRQIQSLSETNARLQRQVADLMREREDLRAHVNPVRALDHQTVVEAIAANPRVRFVVLQDYQHHGAKYERGRVLAANLFPHLATHVESGLQLRLE